MIQRVKMLIKEYGMIEAGDKVVAGVSGGADSVCLLRVLNEIKEELGIKLYVAHIEHGIRGQASVEDARFVENLCHKLGIVCHLYSYQVLELAKETGKSVEEAGRQVRYEAFSKLAQTLGGAKIATAHNSNDAAETMLFHLARGTGLKGLAGIAPRRGNVIRPLLETTREEIEEYLKEIGQDYCTDETNLETDYARNKIRHQVLPVLREVNAGAISHMVTCGRYVREAVEFQAEVTEDLWTDYVTVGEQGIELSEKLFCNQKRGLQGLVVKEAICRMAKESKNVGSVHVEQVRDLYGRKTGKTICLPYGLQAVRDYQGIVIKKREQKEEPENPKREQVLKVPGITRVEGTGIVIETAILETGGGIGEIPRNKYTKWFDYDILKNGLQVRGRRVGDYITIDTQGNKKKLKDYLINEKVPRDERDSLLVIAEGSLVHWVVGMRIGHKAGVKPDTKKILEVRINGGQGI